MPLNLSFHLPHTILTLSQCPFQSFLGVNSLSTYVIVRLVLDIYIYSLYIS